MKLLPKTSLLSILLFLLFQSILLAQTAWINEFHYDNEGSDVNEFVEIVIKDVSSYDLSLFQFYLFNGSNGETYGNTYNLTEFTPVDVENGFSIFYLEISGIQNGPDGFALEYDGSLLQFISYEGSFLGVGGPADNIESIDVGVSESNSSTLLNQSLQLTGDGVEYSDFSWLEPNSATMGQVNVGQSFMLPCNAPDEQAIFLTVEEEDISENQIQLNWQRGNGDAVLVLLKESQPVDAIPENGVTYNADADLSNELADEIGNGNYVVYSGTGDFVNLSGLNSNTEYHFSIFEYFDDTYCYSLIDEVLVVNTNININSDSDIQNPEQPLESGIITINNSSESSSIDVFKFNIIDFGSGDGLPTTIEKMVIEKGPENTVLDWSEIIKSAKLINDGTEIETIQTVIYEDSLLFNFENQQLEIADGDTAEIVLSVWIEEIFEDELLMDFSIPNFHSFEVYSTGSFLLDTLSNQILSNSFQLDVQADQLLIESTTDHYYVNDTFSIGISALDSFENLDVMDRTITISHGGSGTLSIPSNVELIDGKLLLSNLKYNQEEEITITFTDGVLSSDYIIEFKETTIEIDSSDFNNDFGLIYYPNNSNASSFTLSAQNLQDSLLIISPPHFELSLNEEFTQAFDTIFFSDYLIEDQEILVRFSPESAIGDQILDSLKISTKGADQLYLILSAEEATLETESIKNIKNYDLGSRVKFNARVIGGASHFDFLRAVQDSTDGILIQGDEVSQLAFGDSVQLVGTLIKSKYGATITIEEPINILSQDSSSIAAIDIHEKDFLQFEFMRIKLDSLNFIEEGLFKNKSYEVLAKSGDTLKLVLSNKLGLISELIPYGYFDFQGLLMHLDRQLYLYPEFENDLIELKRESKIIIESTDSIEFESVQIYDYSEPQFYALKVENVSSDLLIECTDNFQVSLFEKSNYDKSIQLPVDIYGNLPRIKVYVRFAPESGNQGKILGQIIHSSKDQKQIINLMGVETLITSNDRSSANNLKVYPNPANSYLIIEDRSDKYQAYKILNIEGKEVLKGKFKSRVDISKLEIGVYKLILLNENEIVLKKFIKK
ncbi:T9SS type A sorting domain-containing protein [Marivirga arenosa]|uniref:T9SS type A sorting domain-containing protein n=1 Tax=Marivirga arenosa TaxID=3059076 RepID=A0AA51N8I0_9BACT|nr:T9SS type A sorting domain-containing protein [Marivirga sp. ABR2-2]WMN06465.1 T9SS type A sorting domain-containing protein [Marivirga sp. ABR2-2]